MQVRRADAGHHARQGIQGHRRRQERLARRRDRARSCSSASCWHYCPMQWFPGDARRRRWHERALVTGGAGFIGSHVVDSLVRDGYEVLVVDDLSAGDADAAAARRARSRELDITERAALDEAFDAFKPEAVFHLAAQASVTASVNDPGRDCAVNVRRHAERRRGRAPPRARRSCSRPPAGRSTATTRRCRRARLSCPCRSRPTGPPSSPARSYVRSWSAAHGVPERRHAPRQRLRPAPDAARRGRASSRSSASGWLRASPARCTATARRRATTCTCSTSSRRCAPPAAQRHLQRRHGHRDRRRHALCAARRGRRLDGRARARRAAPGRAASARAWTRRVRAASSAGRRGSRSPRASPATYEAMVAGFGTAA